MLPEFEESENFNNLRLLRGLSLPELNIGAYDAPPKSGHHHYGYQHLSAPAQQQI